MAEPAARIAISHADVFYGPVQALHGLNLRVAPGEVVAVLGGNASGKSTTVKTFLGLVRPSRGTVYLDGERIDGLGCNDVIARGVASIPEGRRVFPESSVRENLLMGAYTRRHAGRRAIADDLEAICVCFPVLRDRLDQAAGSLSGGEQQMLALARAWLRKPSVVAIDEPSMGLSPRFVDTVYEILHGWKAAGITILLVEQNARLALELANRAYVLQHGKVVLEGPAGDLAGDPAVQAAYLGRAG